MKLIKTTHHRQVSILCLGHQEFRSRGEVYDPLFSLSPCEFYTEETTDKSLATLRNPIKHFYFEVHGDTTGLRSCPSPALVDVDAVDFVGADCNLGQGLDHVVALQDNVALEGKTEMKQQLKN